MQAIFGLPDLVNLFLCNILYFVYLYICFYCFYIVSTWSDLVFFSAEPDQRKIFGSSPLKVENSLISIDHIFKFQAVFPSRGEVASAAGQPDAEEGRGGLALPGRPGGPCQGRRRIYILSCFFLDIFIRGLKSQGHTLCRRWERKFMG